MTSKAYFTAQKFYCTLSLAALLLVPHITFAATADKKNSEIENKLDTISNKLFLKQEIRQKLVKKEVSVLELLGDIDNKIRLKKEKLSETNKMLVTKNEIIVKLESSISLISLDIKKRQKLLFKRAKTIYSQTQFDYFDVIMSSEDIYASLRKYEYLRLISKSDIELITFLQENLKKIAKKKQELDLLKKDLATTQDNLYKEIESLEAEENEKSMVVRYIGEEKNLLETTIIELEKSSEQIKLIIKNEKSKKTLTDFKGIKKGTLLWPNLGMVVSFFGKQKHKKFDTEIYRKGIEISSFKGDSIKSVAAGRVIFSDHFQGYGLMIIVDHGKKAYSLYAHLGNMTVSKGDTLSSGDKLGEIGNSGLSEGNKLYFEIRNNGKAVDPLKWLEKKDTSKIMK